MNGILLNAVRLELKMNGHQPPQICPSVYLSVG